MRGVGDEDLMVFDALAHLPEKPVQCGNDTKDLSRDRAADIAQVIGGSVLDRVLQIVQGAQADLHPEPNHQSKCCHQAGDQRRRAARQGGGESIAITVPLPDGDDRIAREVADGRALRHPQNPHRLAPIFSRSSPARPPETGG